MISLSKLIFIVTTERGEERLPSGVFVPNIENGEEIVFGCFSFFFLYSTQNQVSKIIIGLGCVIYHIQALSVVIQTTLVNPKTFF